MGPFVFASDLDGTLIHSRRNFRQGDIEIETIDGEPRGFIRPIVLSALDAMPDGAVFAVVTTRSAIQYGRLRWNSRVPDYAYVANGGVRYTVGLEEPTLLYAEASNWANALNKAVGLLENSGEVRAARIVDGCYALALLKDALAFPDAIGKVIAGLGLRLFIEGKKAYFFPDGLEKVLAIRDLRAMYPDKKLVCAGDSINDLPMLHAADIAITTQAVAEQLVELGSSADVVACMTDNPLDDFVGQWLKQHEGPTLTQTIVQAWRL